MRQEANSQATDPKPNSKDQQTGAGTTAPNSQKASVLEGLPKGLPALAQSQQLQDEAAKTGFDWPDTTGPLDKLKEEINELHEAIAKQLSKEIQDEYGDVLFCLVALARHLNLNAEDALKRANHKFERRFRYMESLDPNFSGKPLQELDMLWNQAKAAGL